MPRSALSDSGFAHFPVSKDQQGSQMQLGIVSLEPGTVVQYCTGQCEIGSSATAVIGVPLQRSLAYRGKIARNKQACILRSMPETFARSKLKS